MCVCVCLLDGGDGLLLGRGKYVVGKNGYLYIEFEPVPVLFTRFQQMDSG